MSSSNRVQHSFNWRFDNWEAIEKGFLNNTKLPLSNFLNIKRTFLSLSRAIEKEMLNTYKSKRFRISSYEEWANASFNMGISKAAKKEIGLTNNQEYIVDCTFDMFIKSKNASLYKKLNNTIDYTKKIQGTVHENFGFYLDSDLEEFILKFSKPFKELLYEYFNEEDFFIKGKQIIDVKLVSY